MTSSTRSTFLGDSAIRSIRLLRETSELLVESRHPLPNLTLVGVELGHGPEAVQVLVIHAR
jgi:hypothetical protein